MKKQLLGYSVLGVILLAGNALAECPNSLSAAQMYDCIVVEGAGDIHAKSVFPKATKSQQQVKGGEVKSDTKLAELKQ